MRQYLKYIAMIVMSCAVFFISCAHSNNIRDRISARTITREDLKQNRSDTARHTEIYGIASFYGTKFEGRKTANGEVYDMSALTAAHRTLPFGTVCKVTNLENNKTVVVRINDRGPFVNNREIDLSRAAARALDALNSGVIKVMIEVLRYPSNN